MNQKKIKKNYAQIYKFYIVGFYQQVYNYILMNLGLEKSIRNQGDGITYFGFQTEDELNENTYINYLLGPKEQEYDEQFIGKYFQIRFDNNTKKNYIKDLGNGFRTFIKLILNNIILIIKIILIF